MNKNGLSEYTNSVHRIGRIGTVIAILIMLGIPVTMCTYFDMWPKAADLLESAKINWTDFLRAYTINPYEERNFNYVREKTT